MLLILIIILTPSSSPTFPSPPLPSPYEQNFSCKHNHKFLALKRSNDPPKTTKIKKLIFDFHYFSKKVLKMGFTSLVNNNVAANFSIRTCIKQTEKKTEACHDMCWKQQFGRYRMRQFFFSFFCLGFLSRPFTNQRLQGKGEGISLTPLYLFHPLGTETLAGRLLQRAHLCTSVTVRLEPGTFGFRAHVANH